LVLALSKPSLTRMRAVATNNALTVRRERACDAFFLGFVRIFAAIESCAECEYKKRVMARILTDIGTTNNLMRRTAT
jgi:hypothetical protein